MSRLRRLALLSLAMLCAVTIGGGAAAAHLLPARLALFRLPTVAARPLIAPGPVLRPAGGTGTGPATRPGRRSVATPAGLSADLDGLIRPDVLGPHVGIVVADLAGGGVLYSRDATAPFAPASTTKLATSVAALDTFGAAARFTTRVVAGASSSSIVLVGGGDPTLAAGRPPASDYPQPATLAALAARTAGALRARGRRSVHLGYDTSLFTGPALAPTWPVRYVTTGNVSPITSLEVDQGRLTAAGAPQDADDPGNFTPRSFDPAADAAAAFAALLRRHGIEVLGRPAPAKAPVTTPASHAAIARVSSPPLAQIVQWMLTESNNVMAEDLARQVAIATGGPASFRGGAAAVMAADRRLGVTGISLVDGSGLSPRDRITPVALTDLIRAAAGAGHAALRPAITGLPVAGFSGTLGPGQQGFGTAGPAALGVVRAKTGNLTTVSALAGLAYARNGQLLAFAVMADRLPKNGLGAAEADMVAIATALAGCGCR